MSQKTHAGENALTMLVQLVKTALKSKVSAEAGKGLSSNDYTTAEKTKLSGVAEGANKTTVEDALNSDSKVNALSAAQGKVLDGKIKEVKDSLGGLGYGDMLKTTYDADEDGVVDKAANADKLGGQVPGYYAPASSVPTKVSQVTNDAGYQTAANVEAAITGKGYQTEAQVDAKISAANARVYKPQGAIAFASLPVPAKANLGFVYNVTDAFTTSTGFLEGAGRKYPAGTNVVVVQSGESYVWDVLGGFYDLSGYVLSSEITELTNQEVQAIWDSVVV